MEQPPSFNPDAYSDAPRYNIRAVVAASGIPGATLRAWERRYGVPRPQRDAQGARLYSEREIALVRWLREQEQRGLRISYAINLLRDRGEGPTKGAVDEPEALRARLLDAVERLDGAAVERIIAEGLLVASVEDVCLNVIQPALYEIGRCWEEGALSVTAEHVGSNILRTRLTDLLRLSPASWRGVTIMVGCAPGELHDIGALMLTLFLRRRGFDLIYAGASIEPDSFVTDVGWLQPAAVCLSASSEESAASLAELFPRLEGSGDAILGFGGRVFNERPELSETMPGMHLGDDALTAVERLEPLVGERTRIPG